MHEQTESTGVLVSAGDWRVGYYVEKSLVLARTHSSGFAGRATHCGRRGNGFAETLMMMTASRHNTWEWEVAVEDMARTCSVDPIGPATWRPSLENSCKPAGPRLAVE